MNISEIKAKLGVTSIDLVRGSIPNPEFPTDKTKATPTVWLRNWDDEKRVAIVMHEDVLKAIQAQATNLIVKTETVEADKEGVALSKGSYVKHTICTAISIEATV